MGSFEGSFRGFPSPSFDRFGFVLFVGSKSTLVHPDCHGAAKQKGIKCRRQICSRDMPDGVFYERKS